MIKISDHIINHNDTLKSALLQFGILGDKLTLFVVNEKEQLIGTLAYGDIRRGLLEGKSIDQKVEDFMFKNFRHLLKGNIEIELIRQCREKLIWLIPVLDNNGKIVQVFDLSHIQTWLPIDAVLMAGGRGERLRPLTDKTPKPLLPVGNKPIIEYNIDHLSKFGIENIYVSVKYLAEQIEDYFGNGSSKGLNIKYIHEDKPLGTIGAVIQVTDFSSDVVLVMNSDLFTDIDFEEMYNTFCNSNADMAVATIPYNVEVPYAIVELEDEKVSAFKEKPTYNYHANAGIYMFRKEMFKFIPKNEKFDVTDLMQLMLDKGFKVVKFPILGYWLDIGKMDDYKKAQEYYKYLKFK